MDISSEEENNIYEQQNDVDIENRDEISYPNEENGDEAIVTNDQDEEEKKPVKAKRVIKNPRPKLNADRLKTPRGLSGLDDCFKRVKFKGKGHEEEDLSVLLKTYEYWCHRLFPKFPFKECLEQIENLGTKGPIQTHLKKVRSGLTEEELPSTNELVEEFDSEEDNGEEVTQATNQSIIADIPVELTEEQLETIRKNREKAEILRKERLRKIQEKATELLEHNDKLGDNEDIERKSEHLLKENEGIDDDLNVDDILECVNEKEAGEEELMEIAE